MNELIHGFAEFERIPNRYHWSSNNNTTQQNREVTTNEIEEEKKIIVSMIFTIVKINKLFDWFQKDNECS